MKCHHYWYCCGALVRRQMILSGQASLYRPSSLGAFSAGQVGNFFYMTCRRDMDRYDCIAGMMRPKPVHAVGRTSRKEKGKQGGSSASPHQQAVTSRGRPSFCVTSLFNEQKKVLRTHNCVSFQKEIASASFILSQLLQVTIA